MDGQFTATSVYQYCELYSQRATVIEEFVDHRAYGSTGEQHVVNQQNICAFDIKR